jgi:NADP-dependent aldehyde dehydrogenase
VTVQVSSVDARTGESVGVVAVESTAEDVAAVCTAAAEAAPAFEAMRRDGRAAVLRAIADALDDDRAAIVELADRETGLGPQRLNGELGRTSYQLRLFADVLDEGSYLEATIDHAGPTPMGPRPDLRRMLVPIGPVAVFGASNFPLAFSVAGGDTASALAAGCPVVVKAHPSHPATSVRVFEAMRAAATGAGAPDDVVALVHGVAAGRALVTHPAIRAVGFTGSLAGGRALFDLAVSRPDPIPFYGELSSVNPLVVTPSAAAERAEQIGRGLVDSATLGAGQFCTKPGLAFVPVGADGDRLREAAAEQLTGKPAGVALNRGISDAYTTGVQRLGATAALVAEAADGGGPSGLRGALFETALDDVSAVADECFGPTTVLVRYADESALLDTLRKLPGELTATIHASSDDPLAARLDEVLRASVGRVIWNGYPTGVAVSWAMQHGGPWPATTSGHTSVGATAIRRFLRPISWQDAPQHVLPPELRDGPVDIPRRVDGRLVLPSE